MERKDSRGAQNILNLIAKSSLIVLLAVLISKILTYVYRIVIVRVYGPEVYGVFSLAIIIFTISITLASLGLYEGLLRYIPFYRGRKDIKNISYLFRKSLLILLISGIFAGALLFFLSDEIAVGIFHNEELIIFLKIFSFFIPFVTLSSGFLSALLSYEKITWNTAIVNFFQNFLKIVFLLFFIFIGMKTNAIIFSYIIGTLSVFILSYFVSKYYLSRIYKKYELSKKKKHFLTSDLLSYSWPMMFSSIIASIFYWTDSFVIGYYMGATYVGIYNIAVPIAMLLTIAPDLFVRLFFPLITKEFSKKNYKIIAETSKQVEKWILFFNVPVLLIILTFPGAIINILFGEGSFLPGMTGVLENSLRMLALGAAFASLQIVPVYLLSTLGKSKIILTNTLIAGLINLLLNILLINKYGIAGAAFSTMIVSIGLCAVYFLQLKKYIKFFPLRRKMINIFIIAFISLIFLILEKSLIKLNLINLLILGFSFLVFYILLAFKTKCFDEYDIEVIRLIKKQALSRT
ncbi:MAG: flippase [Nanoarchaeota archaeon]